MLPWILGGALLLLLLAGGKPSGSMVAPREWRIKVFDSQRGLAWSGQFPDTIRVGDRLIVDVGNVVPLLSVIFDPTALVLSKGPYNEDTELSLVPVKPGRYKIVIVTTRSGSVDVFMNVVSA